MKRSDMDRGDLLAYKSSAGYVEPALILDVDQLWREGRDTYGKPATYRPSDATRYKTAGDGSTHGILAVCRFGSDMSMEQAAELIKTVKVPGPVGAMLTREAVKEIRAALPKDLWLRVINPKQAEGSWSSYWDQKLRSDAFHEKAAKLREARDERRAALWSKVEELVDFGPWAKPDSHGKVSVSLSLLAILLGLGDEVDEEPSETINHRMVFAHRASQAEIDAQDEADETPALEADLDGMDDDHADLIQYLAEIKPGTRIKANRAGLVPTTVEVTVSEAPRWNGTNTVVVTDGEYVIETVTALSVQVIHASVPPKEFDQIAPVEMDGFRYGHLVEAVEAYANPARDLKLRLTGRPTQNSPLTVLLPYGNGNTITAWAQSVKLVEEGTQAVADFRDIKAGDLVEFDYNVTRGDQKLVLTNRIRVDRTPYGDERSVTLIGDERIGPIAAITSSLKIVDTLA